MKMMRNLWVNQPILSALTHIEQIVVGVIDPGLVAQDILLKLVSPGAHVSLPLSLILSLCSFLLRLDGTQVDGVFKLDGVELPTVAPLVGRAHQSRQ